MADEPAKIRLADTGRLLGGRPVAAGLRELVESQARARTVIVDLEGIDAMSPSFADELFAKLNAGLLDSGQVEVANASTEVWALIRVMVARRAEGNPVE